MLFEVGPDGTVFGLQELPESGRLLGTLLESRVQPGGEPVKGLADFLEINRKMAIAKELHEAVRQENLRNLSKSTVEKIYTGLTASSGQE